MKTCLTLLLLGLLATAPARAESPPIGIVAAENFYGDVAHQIAGPYAQVSSILSNPDQDPHLFEASPSVARSLAAARIVILNGLGYDPWMDKLIGATASKGRRRLVVAELANRRPGSNPHIWYDPTAMQALAAALTAALSAEDPAHAAEFETRHQRFLDTVAPITDRIAELRPLLAGRSVTATEPVVGELFAALGLTVRNTRFQLSVMNDTEPAAGDIAAFETDLRTHQVALLAFNTQAGNPVSEHMAGVARQAGVPVIGVSETQPPGRTWQGWMVGTIEAIAGALLPSRK